MASIQRMERIVGHLQPSASPSMGALQPQSTAAGSRSPDDIVIVSSVRTAIAKAKRGAFKDTHPTELLAAVLTAVTAKVNLDPKLVADVVVGNVLLPGGFATQSRMASFLAGYPESVSVSTCNRQCSSGLQAVAHVAAAIKNGYYEIAVAAGVETMSRADMMGSVGEINDRAMEHEKAAQCAVPMGQTSENVARQFGITRQQQDRMAAESHRRAIAAQKEGKYVEIIPVTTKVIDPKTGAETTVTVSKDEGPRADTTEAGLAKLKPAFAEDGTTTAGNSSQVSDGAAAVLLMKRSTAQRLGLPIQGSFRSFAVAGVPPEIMGVGPAFAIPVAVQQAGLKVSDIDIFEINEAFASQATYCVEHLKISMDKVNPLGGAIALGHPLGCTGARQVATLFPELARQKKRFGVVSMCIGTGMGAAAVFENEVL